MHGTGLIGLAGINAEQSTVFDTVGETYRPLTQGTLRKTLFTPQADRRHLRLAIIKCALDGRRQENPHAQRCHCRPAT